MNNQPVSKLLKPRAIRFLLDQGYSQEIVDKALMWLEMSDSYSYRDLKDLCDKFWEEENGEEE